MGTHSGGKMILGSQAGGDCFIMTNCWYFHKMLQDPGDPGVGKVREGRIFFLQAGGTDPG